jgi:hypothetical protein
MIRELDSVVLMRDLPEHGLRAGDVGVVVHVYGEGIGFEVEFVTGDGKTVAVVTLSRDEVRLIGKEEILHVRTLTST